MPENYSRVATDMKPQGESGGLSRKVLLLALAGAFGGFLFGYDTSVVNGAVGAVEGEFGLGPATTGFTVASALLGCVVGAYFSGWFSNRWGRVPVMVAGAGFFFVSAIGSGLVVGAADLIFWRIVGGIGIGIASVIAPAYIAEISPRKVRGGLASLQQLAITLGIFAALLTNALLANAASGAAQQLWWGLEAWRWMFMVEALPALIYGLVALSLPESPRFLVLRGKVEDAREVLRRVIPADEVDDQLEEIRHSLRDQGNEKPASLRGSLFGLKPVVWIGICAALLQQLTGINAIFYYSTTLWGSVGFSEADSFTISAVTASINVAVTFVAIAFVDRIGRRPLFLIGSLGTLASLGTMTMAFSTAVEVGGEPSLPGMWGPVALVAANLYVIFFGATWGPVLWVLLGEIFPNRIRAKAMGLATGLLWLANFVVSMGFPVVSSFSLATAYGIFTAFAAISVIFVWYAIPETRGMSLEQANISGRQVR